MRIAFADENYRAIEERVCLTRGDTTLLRFGIRDDDDIAPVDLSEKVLQLAIGDQTTARIVKRNYSLGGVRVDTGTRGTGEVTLSSADTQSVAPGLYNLEMQVDGKASITPITNGTTNLQGGSPSFVSNDVLISAVVVGSIIEMNGSTPGNTKRVVVTGVDPQTKTITTAGYAWATEPGVAFDVFEGVRKTARGRTTQVEVASDVAV
jgi:hypothetical protein